MTYVVVGEAEVYVCDSSFLFNWLASGYRLYGVADTPCDVQQLLTVAQQEVLSNGIVD